MKKFICTVLIVVLALTSFAGCGTKDVEPTTTPTNRLEKILADGYMTIAISPDFAPSEFIDLTKGGDGEVVGRDVDLAKYIAEYIGVDLVIEQMSFSTCQAAVSLGDVDFSLGGYGKTPEREENMECSTYIMFEQWEDSGQGLIVPAADINKYTDPASFKGSTIAAQNGSLQQGFVEEQIPEAKIKLITKTSEGLMMLLQGQVDGMASAVPQGELMIANYPELAMASFMFDYDPVGAVALCPKGETELMEKINEAIIKADKEGLLLKWAAEADELAESLGLL